MKIRFSVVVVASLVCFADLSAQSWTGTEIVLNHSTLGGNTDYTAFYRTDNTSDQVTLNLQLGDDANGRFQIGHVDYVSQSWQSLMVFNLDGTIQLPRSGTQRKKLDFGAYSYLESRNVGADNNYGYNYGTAILRNAFVYDHSANTYHNPNGYLESQRMEMRAGNWYFDFRPAANGNTGTWAESEWQNRLFIDGNTGNVGIGTNTPYGKRIHVKSNTSNDHVGIIENVHTSGYGLIVSAANDPLRISPAGVYDGRFLIVNSSGKVGIGVTNPDQKLTVDGTVRCEEVKVEIIAGTGPDYVFEPTYNLTPLSEVESYIKANKHLPEVPSAKEMEEEGLNLKEMNLLLLKKVEEITLHLIEKEKQVDQLQKRVAALEKKK